MNTYTTYPPLTLAGAFPHLQTHVDSLLPLQVTDPDHPETGGIYAPPWGLVDPKLTGSFVTSTGYLLLAAHRLGASIDRTMLIECAVAATRFLLRNRRESGLIDLVSVNYDSAPDTAFTVQQLCTLFELAGDTPGDLQPLLDEVETFIRGAVPGILTGGFHTPNHRWVMVSALVQAKALFPDLAVEETVAAYLAESYDIDDEGFFIERSVGVYDAVNDRSLLFIGALRGDQVALQAAARNLELNLHLLNADGTADTGLSRRQDYGTRSVTMSLITCFLMSDHLTPNPRFAAAAQRLWSAARPSERRTEWYGDALQDIGWISYGLLRCADPAPAGADLPTDFARFFPRNRLWRVRRDLLGASVYGDTTRILTLTSGAAELSSIKISQTYFGQYIGRFLGNEMRMEGETLVLHSRGDANPRRPGYELPLGRAVPPDEWREALADRDLRRLPHLTADLSITEAEDEHGRGFDLVYRTLSGMEGVAGQIAFDFPPGGIWETADTRTMPAAGQTIFLKEGFGAYRVGNDVIRIGPGRLTHGMWAMREAEPAPDHVRILVTFTLPADFAFSIRCARGWGSEA